MRRRPGWRTWSSSSKVSRPRLTTNYELFGTGDVGLIEDKSHIDVNKIKKQLITEHDSLGNYKKAIEKLTIAKMKQEMQDEALEKKWKELNMGIDQWKHKYLYPFGNIEPIQASVSQSTQASTIRARSVANQHNHS